MPADYIVKAGETEPLFTQQINSVNGSPVNLAGATVQFQIRSMTQAAPLTLTGTTSVIDATNGIVQYQPSAGDSATSGDYLASWLVTFSNDVQQSFPTDGYLWVKIEPSLVSEPQQIVGLLEVKEYLNVSGTNHVTDGKLLGYIQDVTPLIENVVGPVVLRTFEEWHDGGQYFVTLRRKPSYALGSSPVFQILGCDEYRGPIKYALNVVSDPTQASIYSCMLDERTGTLYRRTTGGGVIPFGAGPFGGGTPQAVHVVYQAGQRTVPSNVRRAALETIRWNYMSTTPTGTGSRSLADADEYSAGPMPMVVPRSVMEWLAPMRRRPAIA